MRGISRTRPDKTKCPWHRRQHPEFLASRGRIPETNRFDCVWQAVRTGLTGFPIRGNGTFAQSFLSGSIARPARDSPGVQESGLASNRLANIMCRRLWYFRPKTCATCANRLVVIGAFGPVARPSGQAEPYGGPDISECSGADDVSRSRAAWRDSLEWNNAHVVWELSSRRSVRGVGEQPARLLRHLRDGTLPVRSVGGQRSDAGQRTDERCAEITATLVEYSRAGSLRAGDVRQDRQCPCLGRQQPPRCRAAGRFQDSSFGP